MRTLALRTRTVRRIYRTSEYILSRLLILVVTVAVLLGVEVSYKVKTVEARVSRLGRLVEWVKPVVRVVKWF